MKASDIPLIDSRQDLDALCGAGQGPVVGLWATTLVNDNTALLLLLREALERRGVRTVFFLTCKEQLPRQIRQLPPASREGLFRVENPHVFAESAFPDLLIANTLTLTSKPADFRGKTMILPHAPSERMPNRLSYWADYLVIPTRDAAPAMPLLPGILNFSDLLPEDRLPDASAPPLQHAVTAIMRLQRGNVEQGAAILDGVSRRVAAGQGTALAAAAVAIGQSLLRHADERRPHAGRYRALHLPVMGLWLSFSSGEEARTLLADALPPFRELARQDARLLMPCVHLAAAVGDDDVRRGPLPRPGSRASACAT